MNSEKAYYDDKDDDSIKSLSIVEYIKFMYLNCEVKYKV